MQLSKFVFNIFTHSQYFTSLELSIVKNKLSSDIGKRPVPNSLEQRNHNLSSYSWQHWMESYKQLIRHTFGILQINNEYHDLSAL
jgi:hypothetical protein